MTVNNSMSKTAGHKKNSFSQYNGHMPLEVSVVQDPIDVGYQQQKRRSQSKTDKYPEGEQFSLT
jgi:hypothetical protein